MKILVINAGSSSLKYQLIDMADESVIAKGICEKVTIEGSSITHKAMINGEEVKTTTVVDMPNHTVAFEQVKKALTEGENKVIDDISEIAAVGHRVVQGGSLFNKSMLINDEVIAGIDKMSALAPLHNPAHIEGINASVALFGENVPQVAVFDNAFHSTMPPEAYMFAIPYELYEKHQLRKYGFHGTSHRFVSARCAEVMGKDIKDLRIVTCHLGNGSSITAVKGGECIDTTMGLTPLDGLIMGTRSGAIDASAVLFLMEKENISVKDMDTFLNKKSGIAAVSGVSSDDRDVKEEAVKNKLGLAERCQLARNMLAYQIKKYIGSYAAAMDGIDAIVFTGGIGENADDLRNKICNELTYLGIYIDQNIGKTLVKGAEGELSTANSKVKVYVLPTNEELVIARDTRDIVNAL